MALVRSHNQKSNENMYDYTIRTKRLADQLRNSYGADLNPTVTRGIEKTMIEHFVRGITSYKTRARMEISEYPDLEHATRNALRLDTLQEQNSYLNEVICAFCNTKGHLERQCRKKQDLMDASNQMAQHGTALRCTKCNGVGHSHMHCSWSYKITPKPTATMDLQTKTTTTIIVPKTTETTAITRTTTEATPTTVRDATTVTI